MNEFVGKKSDFIASILKTKIKLKIQANKSVGALILDYHIILYYHYYYSSFLKKWSQLLNTIYEITMDGLRMSAPSGISEAFPVGHIKLINFN